MRDENNREVWDLHGDLFLRFWISGVWHHVLLPMKTTRVSHECAISVLRDDNSRETDVITMPD